MLDFIRFQFSARMNIFLCPFYSPTFEPLINVLLIRTLLFVATLTVVSLYALNFSHLPQAPCWPTARNGIQLFSTMRSLNSFFVIYAGQA